jgi:hypothetical protein
LGIIPGSGRNVRLSMGYKLSFLEDKNIVRVKIQGRVNFGKAQQYSAEAIKLAHENNCSKFLLDHTSTLPEAGGYKLHTDGDALEHFGFRSNDKIAIVISGDNYSNHINDSSKSNVKWSDTKYFNNEIEAIEWLQV